MAATHDVCKSLNIQYITLEGLDLAFQSISVCFRQFVCVWVENRQKCGKIKKALLA
jgi:hypothetical protein